MDLQNVHEKSRLHTTVRVKVKWNKTEITVYIGQIEIALFSDNRRRLLILHELITQRLIDSATNITQNCVAESRKLARINTRDEYGLIYNVVPSSNYSTNYQPIKKQSRFLIG
jgi:hypothetical protein